MNKSCKGCGGSLKHGQAVFCGKACHLRFLRRPEQTCPTCDKVFRPASDMQRFCSRPCIRSDAPSATAEFKAQVSHLWIVEGLYINEIAERLHVSKNTIIGLGHRMNLPSRKRKKKGNTQGGPLHLRATESLPASLRIAVPERLMAGNEALPPMHPISWGAIAL